MMELLDLSLCDKLRKTLDTNKANESFVLGEDNANINILYGTLDRLEHASTWLNAHPDYPGEEEGLIAYMVYASIIDDCIDTLYDRYCKNEKKPCRSRDIFSHTNFEDLIHDSNMIRIKKKKDPITDRDIFHYLRSLIFAHPSDIYNLFSGILGGQISPWVITGELSPYNEVVKHAVGARIYVSQKDKDGNDIKDMIVSFDDLVEYVRQMFMGLEKIEKAIEEIILKKHREWSKTRVDPEADYMTILRQAERIFLQRGWDRWMIGELISFVECLDIDGFDPSIVQNHREYIISKLPCLCKAINDMDQGLSEEILNELVYSKSAELGEIAGE